MRIEELKKLPKLYRVITVELDVLRNGFGANYGVIYDVDTVVKRKVRRVLDADGWRWAMVREHRNQEQWDYFFAYDKECLHELNYTLGLIK